MKVTILEFNKTNTTTIDEFSDFVQNIVNENNDLLEFRPYENPYTGNVKVELRFGDEKTRFSEVMAYGPGLVSELLDQLNATLAVAENQDKSVRYAGFVPMSKSPRSIGFLVMEKGTDKGSSSAQVQESKKAKQDTKSNARSNGRTKNPV